MHWIALLGAGCLEVAFTTCLKLSDGFSKWTWTAAFVACAVASFALLSVAARTVPLGVAQLGEVGVVDVPRQERHRVRGRPPGPAARGVQ